MYRKGIVPHYPPITRDSNREAPPGPILEVLFSLSLSFTPETTKELSVF